MEILLQLSYDYSVEALKIYRMLKSENNESFLGRKILTNGIELGLNIRTENSDKKSLALTEEMKFMLNVICDADYLSRDITEKLISLANEITNCIEEEN